ncbi:MAG TPA: hypothetical protein VN372_07475 [Methanospirillum sp.]|nr:hypothetical protein [Methanospirillum sp.]
MTKRFMLMSVVLLLAILVSISAVSAESGNTGTNIIPPVNQEINPGTQSPEVTIPAPTGESGVQDVSQFTFDEETNQIIQDALAESSLFYVPTNVESSVWDIIRAQDLTIVRGGGLIQNIPIVVIGGAPKGTYEVPFAIVDANGAPLMGADGNPVIVTITVIVT